jgi:hypothetical protein
MGTRKHNIRRIAEFMGWWENPTITDAVSGHAASILGVYSSVPEILSRGASCRVTDDRE